MIAAGDFPRSLVDDLLGKSDTVCAGQLEPYAPGDELTMSFGRLRVTWTAAHISGAVLKEWEQHGDVADRHMRPVPPRTTGTPPLHVYLERVRADKALHLDPLPGWLDMAALEDGMRFFVEAWPLVFVSFGWAVVGGFGCESASAVLLNSRYWYHLRIHATLTALVSDGVCY